MTQQELERTYQAALNDAAQQLSYRDLSISTLRDKLLQKGHTEDAVDYAIAFLSERNLLNDQRFAESTMHSYQRRGYGAMRIRQELRRRGVAAEEANAVLEDYAPDPNTLHALLDKKLKGDTSDPRQVQKAIAFLQRRGFRWSDIRQALNAYGQSIPDDFS